MPSGATRLWGISLSPDASQLAMSDAGADKIYVLNTAAPTSVRSFNLPNSGVQQFHEPCGLAITNAGMIYYASFNSGGTGGTGFHKLDTTTGNVTDFASVISAGGLSDAYVKVLLTSDNSRVYVNFGGEPFLIETATDTLSSNPSFPPIGDRDYELALSSNQPALTASEFMIDPQLNPEVSVALNDRETGYASAVFGEKLSSDGSLLFAPLVDALDVIDGGTGRLRTRVALPVNLSPMYDGLVSNGKDNTLVAITGQTGTGLAVIDLNSVSGSLLSSNASSGTNTVMKPQIRNSVGATTSLTGQEPTVPIAHWQHTTVKLATMNGAH
jgi:hypothetical protein